MGKKSFFKRRNLFLVSFLAVAGIFSVSAAVVNRQISSNQISEKAEASSTTNANNIRLFLADKQTWFSRDAYGGGGRPYARIWSISISSEADFASTEAAITQAGGSMNQDGSADFGMIHISGSDGQEKQWQLDLPWYITGFTYKFRSTYNNWWTSGDATVTAPCDGDGTNIWGDASSNTPCYYKSTASHTISTTTYSITFNTKGGSAVPKSPYVFKEFQKTLAPSSSDNPTKPLYSFQKWTATDSPSASAFTFGSKLTGDITLFAQYTTDPSASVSNTVLWSTTSGLTYAYSYDSSENPDVAWPGTNCANNIVTIGGNTYYYYVLGQNDNAYIIFNNNSGTQTNNLTLNANRKNGTQYYNLAASQTDDSNWTNFGVSYTVKHYKQNLDGTYPSTPTETQNLTGAPGASVTPSRKTYTGFTAPSGQTKKILADGSMVIEYKYTRNSYTLTWDGGEGAVITGGTSGSVKYGASITQPSSVTKTGYTFSSWSPSPAATMPAANTTYTAVWTTNQYKLTLTVGTGISRIYYKINGAGNFSSVTSTTDLDVNYNSTYYLYAEAATGYTLNSPYSNYNSSNPFSDTKTTSTQSWDPTATINTYTVTIAVNDAEYGSVSQSTVTSVPYGTVISKNNNIVTINGTTVTATPTAATAQYTYAFGSWTNGTATVTDDLTVTANFTRTTNSYTVSFDVQDHGSTPTSQTISYGGKVSRPVQPSEAGYLFGGWYKEPTCENEWNFNSDTVTGTTTIYAKWTKLGYVEFLRAYDADPQYIESIVCYLNEDMPTLSELPTREGYTFAGFYYDDVKYYNADGTSAHVWDHDEAHIVLTARWVDKYAVTITAGDGIDSVYLSLNSSATSGSASGSSFDVGSTVYGFVVLEGGYAHASASWTLVSGRADTKGAIYRVGSLVVATSGNAFGTINATSGATGALEFWEASFNYLLEQVCEGDGSTDMNDLLNAWNIDIYLGDYYDLPEYQKYWLTNSSAAESIEIDFSRYDYVLSKYGYTQDPEDLDKLYDFLGRFSGSQASAVRDFSPFEALMNDEEKLSNVIIISASSISLLSISALSLLMLKKRKSKRL